MGETPNMLDQLLIIAVNVSPEVLMLINVNIINILLLLLFYCL